MDTGGNNMSPKNRYTVAFYKRVSDDHGREKDICQHVIKVLAQDEISAVEKAKVEFCRHQRLSHWSWHADRYEINGDTVNR